MDETAFETWLGWIAAMSEPQRQRVRLALDASEAGNGEIEMRPLLNPERVNDNETAGLII
jgi:hypothetical protein